MSESAAEDAVRIRVAGPGDARAVLALWEQARSAGADKPDHAEEFLLLIERSPDGVLVAEEGGRLVGTVIAVWDGWRGAIHRLAVLPSHRRRGIGRALVEAGEEQLRAKGVGRINVLVFEADPGAGDLWLGRGYVTDPRVARYVRDF
jgi:ribosomal protein S18 acetylase RimI-like enzyme